MTAPHYTDDAVTIHAGDCLEVLTGMPAASVDAVVTDPPYGLEFMGKDWDGADGFRRSLNPADAGRESVFGRTSRTSPEYRTESKASGSASQSGGHSATDGRPTFLGGLNPKCLMCEKWQRGSNPCRCEAPEWTQERLVRLHTFQEWCEVWAAECLRVLKPGGYMLAFGGSRTWHRLAAAVEDAGFEIRDSIAWLYGSGFPKSLNVGDGRGTALKPAFEPIVVGRKPLAGTVAANVLTHGTGALNIDACRTSLDASVNLAHKQRQSAATAGMSGLGESGFKANHEQDTYNAAGRWPTNVVLDDTQAADLDRQTGVLTSGANPTRRGTDKFRDAYGEFTGQEECTPARGADSGGASRFFPTFHYEAKAPTAERPRSADGTAHPTVKPLDLMRWLVRLVTPPGGLVLDPFLGSGTTAEACVMENLRCVGIEREPAYLPLAVARLSKPIAVGFDFGASA